MVELVNVQPAPVSVLTGISEGNVQPGVPLETDVTETPPLVSSVNDDFFQENGVYLAIGGIAVVLLLILFLPHSEQSDLGENTLSPQPSVSPSPDETPLEVNVA